MANEHKRLVAAANKTVKGLKLLGWQLGTHAHPRGAVFAAYAVARRLLRGNLDNQPLVNDVMRQLRIDVETAVSSSLESSLDLGGAQADKNFEILELAGAVVRPPTAAARLQINSIYNAQATAVLSGQFAEGQLLGDAGRVGILTPSPVTRAAVDWLTRLAVLTYEDSLTQPVFQLPPGTPAEAVPEQRTTEYVKQLIAAVDRRTTQTCLLAAGQTQPIGENFQLIGTPRYADEIPFPPFHDYCRSVSTLVPVQFADDQLTADMKEAARIELDLKEKGERVVVTPANALTRVRS